MPTLRAWPAVTKYITNTLYPAVFDGSQAQGYTDQIGRAAALISELLVSANQRGCPKRELTSSSIFTCNTFYLDKAYNNETYAYFFTVPPALHGQDVAYTYFNGPNPENVQNPKIAIALQEYITSFAMDGNPNEAGVPHFPLYGDDATVQILNITGISQGMDPVANQRCNWWQKGLYV